ncbi:cyclic nucleotide-binding domain-containing protein [Myxococcota bacterium]|nr:cyclic nucleotide-binding domain-containing protein [Myxococcota bacterium]MBU1380890.1 cyclic nucleotide-binding domain-containing protein [Myxococcota bacterium]MBU1497018.1 cyclic nucleotide-binding domain-containing protein [Myxococcota bacterium]
MELDPRLIQKAVNLKNSEFFSGLQTDVLIEISRLCEEVHLSAGQILFKEGDSANGLYFILSGSISVVINENVVNTMNSGEVLGEIALLDSGRRSATIVAEETSILLKISPVLFDEILEDYSEVARQTMNMLVKRIRNIKSRMENSQI